MSLVSIKIKYIYNFAEKLEKLLLKEGELEITFSNKNLLLIQYIFLYNHYAPHIE